MFKFRARFCICQILFKTFHIFRYKVTKQNNVMKEWLNLEFQFSYIIVIISYFSIWIDNKPIVSNSSCKIDN